MKCLYILLLYGIALHAQPCAYDRAVYAGQCCQWEKARDGLCELVVEQSDCPDVLYDAGVASFRAGDTRQSIAYFERAVSCAENTILKEKAYFNCGNAYAHDKQFALALASYENALAINPESEKTKHNYEVVKKLLEEELQENQDEDRTDESEQDDESDDTDDQSSDGSDGQQQENSNSESQQQEEDSSSQSSQQSDDGDEGQSATDANNEDSNQQDTMNQGAHGDDEGDEDDGQHMQEQSDAEQDSDEEVTSGNQSDDESESDEQEEKSVGAPVHEALEKEENKWIVSLLEQQEACDNRVNKQLLRERLKEGATSGYGGHNW